MGRYLTPFPGLLASAIEAVLNRAIAVDGNTDSDLARLGGRVLEFELEGLGISLFFSGRQQGLSVHAESDAEPATVITGTPAALLTMAVPELAGSGSGIGISGDAVLAQDFQKLLKRLDPDWEAALTEQFGSVLGPQIYLVLHQGSKSAKAAARTGGDQVGHWIRNESGLVPSADDWARFSAGVDELREAVDRLDSRLRREAGP